MEADNNFFAIKDEANFNYRIGEGSIGIDGLPISKLLMVDKIEIFSSTGVSMSVASHTTQDYTMYVGNDIYKSNGYYAPISVIGYDFSLAYYISIQKLFTEYVENNGLTLTLRFANTGSSSYTISRGYIYMLYALKSNHRGIYNQ